MAKNSEGSLESLVAASRNVSQFSGHGKALGAAGYRVESDHPENCEFLKKPGDNIAISPHEHGFDSILIGAAWDSQFKRSKKILDRVLKRREKVDVDLDIGCLFELKNGKRGAIQAFGDKYGDFESLPYISLSGDERTGAADGHDEFLLVNGKFWDEIKQIIVYIYIYKGVNTWSDVKPQIVIDVPGENDFYVTLDAYNDHYSICAVGRLENIRGGIRLTNLTEYFHGHEEMDRAFGFGLNWQDGQKDTP